jgi:hypothetical protein
VVQNGVENALSFGKSVGAAAQEGCEQAYSLYQGVDNVNNKDDYLRGCEDAIKATPLKASMSATVVPPSKKGPGGATVPNT